MKIFSYSKLTLFLLVIVFIQCKNANPNNEEITDPNIVANLPFTFTSHNNISIPALINETDSVDLMFHTANNYVGLIESAVKEMSSIQFDGSEEAGSWGGGGDMRYSENNILQIGNMTWDSVLITESRHSCHFTDGKFGLDKFPEEIVGLDFEEKVMTIYKELPSEHSSYQKYKVKKVRSSLFLEGTTHIGDQSFQNEFMIHSGYVGTVLYDDEFVQANDLNSKLEVISESELKDSFGNITKRKKVILPKFTIAGEEFVNIPVGIFDGEIARQKISVLGGDLIKRFHILFDVKNNIVYLKPNKLVSMGYSEK